MSDARIKVEERSSHGERCAFCHGSLDGEVVRCEACHSECHAECRADFGACPTLGCREGKPMPGHAPVRVVPRPEPARVEAREDFLRRHERPPLETAPPEVALTPGELLGLRVRILARVLLQVVIATAIIATAIKGNAFFLIYLTVQVGNFFKTTIGHAKALARFGRLTSAPSEVMELVVARDRQGNAMSARLVPLEGGDAIKLIAGMKKWLRTERSELVRVRKITPAGPFLITRPDGTNVVLCRA